MSKGDSLTAKPIINGFSQSLYCASEGVTAQTLKRLLIYQLYGRRNTVRLLAQKIPNTSPV
jgi:hypothetical protein